MITENVLFEGPRRRAKISHCSRVLKGKVSNTHIHPELEFLAIQSGTLSCCVNDICFSVHPGEIVFINSNSPHSTEALTDNTIYNMVQFRCPSTSNENLKYLSKFLRQPAAPFYVFKNEDEYHEDLTRYIKDIFLANTDKDISHDYYITANVCMILALLYKKNLLLIEEDKIDMPLINKLLPVFEYTDKNYSIEFDLEKVASIISLNKSYFCRLFRKATGTSFTDYLNFLRICKAEELIKQNMNFSEIAYNVGFSSLSYFNRVFKKYKHYSPTSYKKMYNHTELLL